MPERRRFHRWTCKLRCGYDESNQAGYITDLSYGGARISGVGNMPQEGTDIEITIYPSIDSKGIEFKAHVSYVNPEGYFGIQFYLTAEEKADVLVPLFQTHLDKD